MKFEDIGKIRDLLVIMRMGALTPEQQAELKRLLAEYPQFLSVANEWERRTPSTAKYMEFNSINSDRAYATMQKRIATGKTSRRSLLHSQKMITWVSGIAAVFLLFFGIRSVINLKDDVADNFASSIYGKPILHFEDGRTLELDGDVIIAHDGEIIIKSADGLTNTIPIPKKSDTDVIHARLSTPKGSTLRITLDDGTIVHLNADSELRYPAKFCTLERRVYAKGELFFEVAKDKARPFYVATDHVEVRVYGTEFNLNTRRDDNINAVLIEGSIGIKSLSSGEEMKIVSGQQIAYNTAEKKFDINTVNTKRYNAWLDGYFDFDNATLESIMEELVLWYDFDFKFDSDKVRYQRFSGRIKKNEKIQIILESITDITGVRFDIKKETLLITK